MPRKIEYADDGHESVCTLFRIRMPALLAGLALGLGISFVTSNFEEILTQNIHVAFFMPFVIYIADSIGTQTETIFSRSLRNGKDHFWTYLRKESTLGLIFGTIFAFISGSISWFWLSNKLLSSSVALATFIAIVTAPVIAMTVTQVFQLLHEDPAADSGPITTVIQDMVSIIVYGMVCSAIML